MKKKTYLTKARKLKILKAMRKIINDDYSDGLCSALFTVLSFDEWVVTDLENFIKKPKDASNYYWYPLNKAGQAKRLKLIDKAIKKLQCK